MTQCLHCVCEQRWYKFCTRQCITCDTAIETLGGKRNTKNPQWDILYSPQLPRVTAPENESVLLHSNISLTEAHTRKPENEPQRKLTSEIETPKPKKTCLFLVANLHPVYSALSLIQTKLCRGRFHPTRNMWQDVTRRHICFCLNLNITGMRQHKHVALKNTGT